MKNPIVCVLAGLLLLCSCSNNRQDRKEVLSAVLKIHDQTMKDDEAVQRYKRQLDTLVKTKPQLHDQIVFINDELVAADSTMDEWMHKFNPDTITKRPEQATAYLKEQQKQLEKIDGQLQIAADKAGKFISLNR